MLVKEQPVPLSLRVMETDGGLSVLGAGLELRIDRDPWKVRFLDSEGADLFRENPGDVDGLGRPFVLPLGFVRSGGDVSQTTFAFHLHPDEHLFGLGEKFLPLDRKGQRIISWTQDAFGSTSERSHKNIPFLTSTRGYGLFLDTGSRVTWDLGATSCQSAMVAVEAPSFRAYLIKGPSPADLLARYAMLAGHAPVPPKWSFGLWVSSGGTYRDRKTVERLIDGLDREAIPADVVHLDPWWMRWRTYCDFRWDSVAFPDPEGFVRSLHEKGLKLCLWEHPYISVESDLFAEGKARNFFVKRPDGDVYVIQYGLSLAPRPDGVVREATPANSWNAPVAIIDLTNPDALAWFQDLHRPMLRMGVDLFKTDFGEDVPVDAVFHNGQTGRSMHNLYPLLYNEAVSEVTRQERGHGLVWGRAGTGGSQRTPVCWSGDPAADFESLACTIRGGLSVGLSGVPFWSNDIGGYRGMPDPELYVRWAQFGLLCSHSRMHGDSPREPWHFGEEAVKIVRRYVSLRYRLFPYFYSCAHGASKTGIPVLRAMSLEFPDDPNSVDKDFQFMLGPFLLVAPVTNRTGERTVYLPQGEWMDFWTGEMHQGPCTLHILASLETIPLFMRGGAILPTMIEAIRIPQAAPDPLIVEVVPASNSTYEFHEDEGTTTFTVQERSDELRLQWSGPVQRRIVFRLRPARQEKRYARLNASRIEVQYTTGGILEAATPRAAGGSIGFTHIAE
jgi:alpha-D-xyloside xylohydrolase